MPTFNKEWLIPSPWSLYFRGHPLYCCFNAGPTLYCISQLQHRLLACTGHNHTKSIMTTIIRPLGYERVYYKVADTLFHIQGDELCELELDIFFHVRCGSPGCCFVGHIKKQRTDSQSC